MDNGNENDNGATEAVGQMSQVNRSRASYYRMLASLFYRELGSEQIARLAQTDFTGLDAGEELMGEGYALIAHAVRKPDRATRQKLAVDYARVFLAAGVYDDHRAIPYESVFTSEDGLLMQDARDDVYRRYCAEHVGVDEDSHEPEDHIAFECEFMSTLAERADDALQAGDFHEAHRLMSASHDFHRTHLENWIDAFCDRIDSCAQTEFYRGVSKLARGFIAMDRDSIEDIVDVLKVLDTASEAA